MREFLYKVANALYNWNIPTANTEYIIRNNCLYIAESEDGKWLYYQDINFDGEMIKVSKEDQIKFFKGRKCF